MKSSCFINEITFNAIDHDKFLRILNIFHYKHRYITASPFYFLQGMEHICGFLLSILHNEILTYENI